MNDFSCRWQPLLMIVGSKPIVCMDSLPSMYSKAKLQKYLQSIDHWIEKDQENIVKLYSYRKDEILEAEGIKENKHFNQFQAECIGLKRFLLLSSRLNVKHYSDAELIAGGLNSDELMQARIPIELEEIPEMVNAGADKVPSRFKSYMY